MYASSWKQYAMRFAYKSTRFSLSFVENILITLRNKIFNSQKSHFEENQDILCFVESLDGLTNFLLCFVIRNTKSKGDGLNHLYI